jgi:hypothetical protein
MKRLRALVLLACCSSFSIATATGQAPIPPPPGSEPSPPPKPPASTPAPPPAAPKPAAPSAATSPSGPPLFQAPPVTTQADLEKLFDAFFKAGLDTERPLAVNNFRIKRDTFELTLKQGTLYLANPIEGQVTGAYFSGQGTVRLALPNAYDRKDLLALYGKPVVDETLSEAVLRFDDDTDREILAACRPGTATGGDAAGTWSDRLKVDSNSFDMPIQFLDARVNGVTKPRSFFLADMKLGDGKTWYGFLHDGRSRVENSFYREEQTGSAGKRLLRQLGEFHRPEDYDPKGNYDVMPESDNKDVATVRHVQMGIDIPTAKSVSIDAQLRVEALRDGVRGVTFQFNNNLGAATWDTPGRTIKTTLVAGEGDAPLPYLHRWHELLVLLPKPLAKGEQTVIHVKATEDTVIQLTSSSFWIYNTYPWFPQIGYLGGRSTLDWTVKVLKPLKIAGTGDLVKEWEEDNMNCAHWKSDIPVQLASFIFGDFRTTDGSYKREPPGTGEVGLRLLTSAGHSVPSQFIASSDVGVGTAFTGKIEFDDQSFKGNPQNILHNVSEGLKSYETIFGPFPFNQLDIAEMAPFMGFAQSPAGIVLVSSIERDATVTESYQQNDYGGGEVTVHVHRDEQGGLGKLGGGGVGDQFLFHELAHQWWGHQIGWAGDEDTWVSESWAEYSSGLMIDAIDHKRFNDMRKKWRQYAMEGDPHGTIATARWADAPGHGGTYYRMVYAKGPCVVHMLRTWMGWDNFTKYVSTVQSKYKGTNINTDTLAREASKILGYDMFPFFDQWVRDRGIPKVHYSWSSAADTDGKQVITIRTRQEDEANAKILMVPIALDFGKGAPTVVPKPILKAQTEIQLRVPSAPKSVVLDPDESQLAVFIPDQK